MVTKKTNVELEESENYVYLRRGKITIALLERSNIGPQAYYCDICKEGVELLENGSNIFELLGSYFHKLKKDVYILFPIRAKYIDKIDAFLVKAHFGFFKKSENAIIYKI